MKKTTSNELVLTDETIKKFGQYLKEEERSENTIGKYIRDIRKFYEFLPPDKLLTREVVLDYKRKLKAGYKITSVNSMLAALNQFLAYLGRHELKVKRFRTQQRVFRNEEKELVKSEYERLIKTARKRNNIRLGLIIETIGATGIRVSELAHFTVEALKSGKVIIECKGKLREILIPGSLRKKLQEFVYQCGRKSGCVFATKGNQPVNRSNIWSEMKKLCQDAGVNPEKVYPHNLRHLFARVYYKLEKDLVKLADILGHSSLETTRIYTMSSGREHLKQMERLGLVLTI